MKAEQQASDEGKGAGRVAYGDKTIWGRDILSMHVGIVHGHQFCFKRHSLCDGLTSLPTGGICLLAIHGLLDDQLASLSPPPPQPVPLTL